MKVATLTEGFVVPLKLGHICSHGPPVNTGFYLQCRLNDHI